jgi:glycosyltransferase involved in cell wall biosynthesis
MFHAYTKNGSRQILKVGIVVSSFSPFINSNERGLASSLAKLGQKVTVITTTAIDDRTRPYLEAPAGSRKIASSLEYDIQYLPCKLLVKNNAITWGVAQVFRGYDSLLIQEDYPYLSKLSSAHALRKRIPFLISCERYYYSNSPLTRALVTFLDHSVHRAMWKACFALTFHSRASMEFYLHNAAPETKAKWIPVGIDVSHFKEDSNNEERKDDEIRMLCVARLEDFKGQRYLIRAIRLIKDKYPNVKLTLLGRGSKGPSFQSLIKDLRLEDTISLNTTAVSYSQMPKVYQDQDIYVQPSLMEPFGIAVLEAMACGKPVVGSNVGGMRDTILDGVNGFLVPPGDSQALASALSKLLQDPGARYDMGKESAKRAREIFDWNKVASSYVRLLNRVELF